MKIDIQKRIKENKFLCDTAEIIEVIRVEVVEGKGIEDNPKTRATYYQSLLELSPPPRKRR